MYGTSIPTLTAIMYAMVKNVVNPARISVMNLAPFRSFSYNISVNGLLKVERPGLTWPDPSRRNTLPNVDVEMFASSLSIEFLNDCIFTKENLATLLGTWRKRG